jgi:catechol 2,3-dioxygenase-like lactoylglutathione lyase family enzyme
MEDYWPDEFQVAQFRIARPTQKLDKVVEFYGTGLGLPLVGSFKDHNGYSGVMFGLPGRTYHLEFTQHSNAESCTSPSRDNLLVFYVPDMQAMFRVAERIAAMGYLTVAPENPYWAEKGITIEDPEGWRIVLMNTSGI